MFYIAFYVIHYVLVNIKILKVVYIKFHCGTLNINLPTVRIIPADYMALWEALYIAGTFNNHETSNIGHTK